MHENQDAENEKQKVIVNRPAATGEAEKVIKEE